MTKSISYILIVICLSQIIACKYKNESQKSIKLAKQDSLAHTETFGHDYNLAKKYLKKIILLQRDSMEMLIVPQFQGRVMTTSSRGMNGTSYGWINDSLISSGKYMPHINAFGGEERIWLGPEGGQFGLFFKKGDSFNYNNWQTPPVLDTVSFETESQSPAEVTFTKKIEIQNYSGTAFIIALKRTISLFSKDEIQNNLGLHIPDSVSVLGYKSVNVLKNTGTQNWDTSKGVLSIWILSMLKASDNNTMIIPYKKDKENLLNDTYFGKIPSNRLIKGRNFALFKGDAKYRGKIGLSPQIATGIAASFDAQRQVLTVIKYDLDSNAHYVNSMWVLQKNPFNGDVFNAYNDGPNETRKQLGAFYEMESSSPAIELRTGHILVHTRTTYHFEGSLKFLNTISEKLLGVNLNDIQSPLLNNH